VAAEDKGAAARPGLGEVCFDVIDGFVVERGVQGDVKGGSK
jgi:hypothetical protein